MSYTGPSIIGNTGTSDAFDAVVIDDYLHIIGINQVAKFTVQDSGNALILGVNTVNDTVTIGGGLILPSLTTNTLLALNSAHQVVSATSVSPTLNNVTLTGTTTINNTLNVSAVSTFSGQLTINGLGNSNKFIVYNNAGSSVFRVNTSTNDVATLNNTLDDGTGSMIVVGNLSLLASSSTAKFSIQNAGGSTMFLANAATSAVFTGKNTLDTGNGSMVVIGYLQLLASADPTKFRVQNSVGGTMLLANGITSAFTTLYNTLDDGTGQMLVANQAQFDNNVIVEGSVLINSTNAAAKFQILNSSSATVFTVNTSTNAVTTLNNTLDDGGGASTFTGAMTINGAAASQKFGVIDSSSNVIFRVNTSTSVVTTRLSVLDDGTGNMSIGRTLTIGSFASGTPGVHTIPWLMGTYSTTTAIIIPFDPFNVNNPITNSNIYRVDIHIPTLTQTGATAQRLWVQLLTSCTAPTVVTTSTYSGYGSLATSAGSGSVSWQGSTNTAQWQILTDTLGSTGSLGINLSLTWNPAFVPTTTYSRINMLSEVYGFDGSNNVKASMANLITDAAGTNLPRVCGLQIIPAGTGFAFSIPTYPSVYITPFRA